MESKREKLFNAYENLLRVRGECAFQISNECTISDLTVRQIEYLKIIDNHRDITFSRLADITRNSKPTITEMINKFLHFDCVFKEKSSDDARVSYIRLTDKGEHVARHELITIKRVVDRILESLNEKEVEQLIALFTKVK
jgi:DNA-binding MarR family transcriptional regulator